MPSLRRIATFLAGLSIAAAAGLSALPPDIWAHGFGGPGRERAGGVAPDRGGTVYTAGRIDGTATFGSSQVTSADADALVAALDKNGQPTWAYALGGPGADEARAVAVLPEGDVFVVGSFSGVADFAPGPDRSELASAGGTDVFVLRLTPAGTLVWARRLGGPKDDQGIDVAVNARGVWVAGSFQGTLEAAASHLAGAGQADGFLARFDLAGTPQWAARIGGKGDDEAVSVAVEADGSAWVAGSFEGEAAAGAAGGATLASAGKTDGFLAHLSPEGNVAWSGRIGGKGDDAATAVAAGPGGVWLTGRFSVTADLDPGPSVTSMASVGKTDTFVARLGKTGDLRWVQRLGDAHYDTGTGIAPDSDGGVWALSIQIERSGFRLDPESTDDRAALVHFNRDGAPQITRDLAGEGGLRALDLALDSAGNPCVAGVFRGKGTVITGFEIANLPGAGQTDALVARIVK